MNKPGHIILPTAYFPPISYFAHIINLPVIYIEQKETFPKQTYRNRCEIMTASGKSNLIIPVTRPHGNHTMTQDIEICYREPWQHHHWKTLQACYRSSPFFNYYDEIIYLFFEKHEKLLLKHNSNILKTISTLIGIDVDIQFTEDYDKNPEGILDLRSDLSPKIQRYSEVFPPYPQVFEHKSGFTGGLSILDLLFNMGPESGRYLRRVIGH